MELEGCPLVDQLVEAIHNEDEAHITVVESPKTGLERRPKSGLELRDGVVLAVFLKGARKMLVEVDVADIFFQQLEEDTLEEREGGALAGAIIGCSCQKRDMGAVRPR